MKSTVSPVVPFVVALICRVPSGRFVKSANPKGAATVVVDVVIDQRRDARESIRNQARLWIEKLCDGLEASLIAVLG